MCKAQSSCTSGSGWSQSIATATNGWFSRALTALQGNGALDQDTTRPSSCPAKLNEHLLALASGGSKAVGKRGVPPDRAAIVEVGVGSRWVWHCSLAPLTCNTSLASRSEGIGNGCESTPS